MEPMQTDDLKHAVQILKDGGIVIYPTDTAFGIGCRIDREDSVSRLFTLRKRPVTQATPVLVSSIAMALPYFDSPSDIVRQMMRDFWPGALTIVYRGNCDAIPALVRGQGETVGLRMPNHPIALHVIEAVGVPILGPSANFHGEKTPFRYEDLDPELLKLVDGVVPGVCSVGNVSTVVDCTVDPYKIVRQGAVVLP